MEKSNNYIQVEYLGRIPLKEDEYENNPRSSRNDNHIKTPPMDIFMMPLEIGGRNIKFFFSTEKEKRFSINSYELRQLEFHNVIDFYNYFTEGEEETEDYQRFEEFKKTLIQETEVGKAGEIIDFNLAGATIDTNIPDKNTEHEEIEKKIIEKLCDLKRQKVINARKESFYEHCPDAEEKLDKVLLNLDDSKKEKAKQLYIEMIPCLISGKYTLRDFYFFMNNLEKVVQNELAFYSRKQHLGIGNTLTPFTPLSKSKFNDIPNEGLDIKRDYLGREKDSLNVLEIYKDTEIEGLLSTDECKKILEEKYGFDDIENIRKIKNTNLEIPTDFYNKKKPLIKINKNGEFTIISGTDLEQSVLLEIENNRKNNEDRRDGLE